MATPINTNTDTNVLQISIENEYIRPRNVIRVNGDIFAGDVLNVIVSNPTVDSINYSWFLKHDAVEEEYQTQFSLFDVPNPKIYNAQESNSFLPQGYFVSFGQNLRLYALSEYITAWSRTKKNWKFSVINRIVFNPFNFREI